MKVVSPIEDATYWIKRDLDKPGLLKKKVSDELGEQLDLFDINLNIKFYINCVEMKFVQVSVYLSVVERCYWKMMYKLSGCMLVLQT